jgi:prepilin-type N-terminal cleavage/methylation domain-containing protein
MYNTLMLGRRNNGFTLIEIVLVMAIAGLILVIVFFALAGSQRSRRDNARKHDAARVLAAVETCAGNNNGKYDGCDDPSSYFNPNVTPDGGTYAFTGAGLSSFEVNIAPGNGVVPCPGSGVNYRYTVTVGQEVGADYCIGS